MTVNSNFRTLAFAMRNVSGMDTYAVLNAADAVVGTVEGLVAQGVHDAMIPMQQSHDALLVDISSLEQRAKRAEGDLDRIQVRVSQIARRNADAVRFMEMGQKVRAVKVIRDVTGCSLRIAIDAVNTIPVEPLAEWEKELLRGV